MAFISEVVVEPFQLKIGNASAELYNGLTWRLYQNDPVLSPNMDISEIVECDFAGYSPISAGDYTFQFFELSGYAFFEASPIAWMVTANGATQYAVGYFCTDSSGELASVVRNPVDESAPMFTVGDAFGIARRATFFTEPRFFP